MAEVHGLEGDGATALATITTAATFTTQYFHVAFVVVVAIVLGTRPAVSASLC